MRLNIDQELRDMLPPLTNPVNKWNITENTNWHMYQNAVAEEFTTWNCEVFKSIDDMWTSFKKRITLAGERTVGFKSFKSKKAFWNKEIDKLIQDRRKANRLF